MKLLLALAGLLFGSYIGGESGSVLGAVIGALLGVCFARLSELNDRLVKLEKKSGSTEAKQFSTEQQTPSAWSTPEPPTVPEAEPEPAVQATHQAETVSRQSDPAPTVRRAPEPTLFSNFVSVAKNWLTTGNIPVKVGVIVSFFGVAFLFKYAVDRQLLQLSIELRLIGVAIFGISLLAIGWRLRDKALVYALNLQGGGIGILYLTIFAAMRLYELLPAGLSFVLLVALTVFTGILAIAQNSRALAFFGIIGGFLAPILVSTGSGNHVVLFSYYLILNVAILGIAWFRSWRELNLLGFAFTFVIGGVWGYNNYRPELFASTEPFLLLNFIFYQAVAILFSIKQEPKLKGFVDGTLVFGTPVVAFALQARIVSDFEYGLAISALVAAMLYIATAITLFKARPQQFRLMAEAFLALAVVFGTIALPLALDARWTAVAWAVEGAALIWVAIRQNRTLAKYAGSLLLIASGIAFSTYGWKEGLGIPVLNGNYLGGMLIGLASVFSGYLIDTKPDQHKPNFIVIGRLIFSWGLLWCVGSGFMEIFDRLPLRYAPAAITTYLAIVATVLLVVAEKVGWTLAKATTLLYLPSLALPVVLVAAKANHPFADLGWIAWPLAFGVQYLILSKQEARFRFPCALQHSVVFVSIAILGMWETTWQVNQLQVGRVWTISLTSFIPGALVLLAFLFKKRSYWPVTTFAKTYLTTTALVLITLQLGSVALLSLTSGGNPKPIQYIPVLNPADISMALALVIALRWLTSIRQEVDWLRPDQWVVGIGTISVLAFFLTTASIMRAVHNFGGIPWESSALASSVLIQATLSMYWAILGVSAMALGARLKRRIIWLVGSGLMAIVVAKLFLIDLGNTETVERIVSFIGTGVLLLVVGYFAPVPPRNSTEAASTEGA